MDPRPATATVRFLPSGREVVLPVGATLLDAARLVGLPLASSCDGQGSCGWCRLRAVPSHVLSAPDDDEQRVLARIGARREERLACRAQALGDVSLTASYW
jgi:adenylate cyclase